MQNQIDSSFAELQRSGSQKRPSRKKYIIPDIVAIVIIGALFISFLKWEPKPDPASEKIIREEAAHEHFSQTQIRKGLIPFPFTQISKDPNLYSQTRIRKDFKPYFQTPIRIDPNSLTDEDFAKIKNIDIAQKELSDIRFLKKFTNLEKLTFFRVYPVSKTPKWRQLLVKLRLFKPPEQSTLDLSPLANLKNLQILTFYSANIADITPLKNLKALRELVLTRTDVSDISAIANLTNLQRLDLQGTNVSDIKPVTHLINLKVLILSSHVSEIKSLENLKNLQELDLSNSKVSNISVLANLTNLNKLSLADSNVNDITPLANLKNLETLYLGDWEATNHPRGPVYWDSEHTGVKINDIKPLANLTNLRKLFLDETQVSDIKPLANIPNLQELSLCRSKVTDFSVLLELKHLHTLYLAYYEVPDTRPLSEQFLDHKPVRDIKPLEILKKLNEELSHSDEGIGAEQAAELRDAIPRINIVNRN
jgi:internalin A